MNTPSFQLYKDNQLLKLSSSPTLTISSIGNYPANTLAVTRITDENGRSTLEFTDMYGQKNLTRVKGTDGTGTVDYFDTYYVYDAIGRLTAVIPPALSAVFDGNATEGDITAAVADFAYAYRYDNRGNVIARKLPGCGWNYYIYDKG